MALRTWWSIRSTSGTELQQVLASSAERAAADWAGDVQSGFNPGTEYIVDVVEITTEGAQPIGEPVRLRLRSETIVRWRVEREASRG